MNTPNEYELRMQVHIGQRWPVWFEGLSLRHEGSGDPVKGDPVVHQANLHGVRRSLVAVLRVEARRQPGICPPLRAGI
jgi:hypothetical protein